MNRHRNADPQRRCVLTGRREKAEYLVRFVEDPNGIIVPDIAMKLPGRGVWVAADKAVMDGALGDGSLLKAFSRALKKKILGAAIPNDLTAIIERLLARRLLDRLGLEKRAGRIILGFEKVHAGLKDRKTAVAKILQASDASNDGRSKIAALAKALKIEVIEIFDRKELSLALGHENVVHVLLVKGGLLDRLEADIVRLAGFRKASEMKDYNRYE